MFSLYTTPSFYAAPVAPQPTLTTLFRLLDDFDSYAQVQAPRCQPRHVHRRQRPTPIFRPRFDVRETESAYELHGNLPGVSREHLDIEFTGPETLVVKGRVVRTYKARQPQAESDTPAAEQPQSQPETQSQPEPQPEQPATEPEPEPEHEPEAGKDEFVVVNNHHATVEDDPEDDEVTTTLSARSASPVPTPTETPRTEVAQPAQPAAVEKQSADKVWVYERTVGEFARTFNFPGRVEQEAVTATLDNGVLSIVVPKAKAPVARRIAIN